MISIKNLTKTYGELTALNELSFELDGGVLGVVAPKGSGKTSLLNIIAGVTAPTSGEVVIDDAPILDKRKIGYLQEGTPLYADMTPCEYLLFYGSAKKISKEKLYRQIDEVFELLGLEGAKNVLIQNLSTSERQKLGLASTLLGNPSTVLLDELFSGMTLADVADTKSVIKMLGQIKTVIITSPSLLSIGDVCDKALILAPEGNVMLESAEEIAEEMQKLASLEAETEEAEEIIELEEVEETVEEEVEE